MNKMKGLVAVALSLVLVGCVSLPPVVHVEHKSDQKEMLRRLDSIEQRLDRMAPPGTDEELRREVRRLQAELDEMRRQAER